MSDVRLAAALTDDELAQELVSVYHAILDPDQDVADRTRDPLLAALLGEAAARWVLSHWPPDEETA
jgi:hypothetical protein